MVKTKVVAIKLPLEAHWSYSSCRSGSLGWFDPVCRPTGWMRVERRCKLADQSQKARRRCCHRFRFWNPFFPRIVLVGTFPVHSNSPRCYAEKTHQWPPHLLPWIGIRKSARPFHKSWTTSSLTEAFSAIPWGPPWALEHRWCSHRWFSCPGTWRSIRWTASPAQMDSRSTDTVHCRSSNWPFQGLKNEEQDESF